MLKTVSPNAGLKMSETAVTKWIHYTVSKKAGCVRVKPLILHPHSDLSYSKNPSASNPQLYFCLSVFFYFFYFILNKILSHAFIISAPSELPNGGSAFSLLFLFFRWCDHLHN